MFSEWDKNSRGLGLLLRLLGLAVPAALFFVLFLLAERGSRGIALLETVAARVLRIPALLWSWPYGMYHEHPVSFGALGLASVVMAILVSLRHDRRGWVTILVFSFGFGWLVATIAGQAQGS
jgi:uncharacterized membrane protein YoaK (UPF0700 family)